MDKKEFYELLKEVSKISKNRYGKKYPCPPPDGPIIWNDLAKIVMMKAGKKSSKRWR